MENKYLKNQIEAMILYVQNFKSVCQLACLQDDQTISAQENKIMQKIDQLSDEFISGLKKIK